MKTVEHATVMRRVNRFLENYKPPEYPKGRKLRRSKAIVHRVKFGDYFVRDIETGNEIEAPGPTLDAIARSFNLLGDDERVRRYPRRRK